MVVEMEKAAELKCSFAEHKDRVETNKYHYEVDDDYIKTVTKKNS